MAKIKVLVGCEFSGVVGQAFQDVGCDVTTCDLLPSENPNVKHYQGDVRDIMNNGFDIGIFHPPCTRLCNSGVMWLAKRNLWDDMKEGAMFFNDCFKADIPLIALENPIPHKYALEIIGKKYTQIIQPWQFGHGETKSTCFWLKGLPKLVPTDIVEGREQRLYRLPPGQDRSMLRSKTYPGIAQAMAQQWGVGFTPSKRQ